jgi:hypothetical protein
MRQIVCNFNDEGPSSLSTGDFSLSLDLVGASVICLPARRG